MIVQPILKWTQLRLTGGSVHTSSLEQACWLFEPLNFFGQVVSQSHSFLPCNQEKGIPVETAVLVTAGGGLLSSSVELLVWI